MKPLARDPKIFRFGFRLAEHCSCLKQRISVGRVLRDSVIELSRRSAVNRNSPAYENNVHTYIYKYERERERERGGEARESLEEPVGRTRFSTTIGGSTSF